MNNSVKNSVWMDHVKVLFIHLQIHPLSSCIYYAVINFELLQLIISPQYLECITETSLYKRFSFRPKKALSPFLNVNYLKRKNLFPFLIIKYKEIFTLKLNYKDLF